MNRTPKNERLAAATMKDPRWVAVVARDPGADGEAGEHNENLPHEPSSKSRSFPALSQARAHGENKAHRAPRGKRAVTSLCAALPSALKTR